MTLQIRNLKSTFRCVGRSQKQSVQFRGAVWHFVTYCLLHGEKLLAPSPNPQPLVAPLVSCLQLLTQHIRSYPPRLQTVSSTFKEDVPQS